MVFETLELAGVVRSGLVDFPDLALLIINPETVGWPFWLSVTSSGKWGHDHI